MDTDVLRSLRQEAARRPGGSPTLLSALRFLASEVGLRIVMQYRIAMALSERRVPLLPVLISRRLTRHYGIDIERGADLGYRVQLPHPVGVVIGAGVVVHDGALIQSNVTLGQRLARSDRPDGYPVLGTSAHIGSGARVLGPVVIGERAEVGANSVVVRDVAPWTVVAGAPAKQLRRLEPA